MWSELLTAASTVLGRRAAAGPVTSGGANFIDASFDNSQWTVATGNASARAENSKVDVPVAASSALAAQSPAPYVGAGGLESAGFGGLSLSSVLMAVALAGGLALVVRKAKE